MDDDGNVIFEADIDKKSISMNPDSVHIGDKTISEVLSDNKNMTMLLSDDYQGIPVDSSGNYKSFPSGTRPQLRSCTAQTVYTSSTDEAEVTHLLYSAIAAINGKLLTTRSGKFLAVPRDFVDLRVSLYAARRHHPADLTG